MVLGSGPEDGGRARLEDAEDFAPVTTKKQASCHPYSSPAQTRGMVIMGLFAVQPGCPLSLSLSKASRSASNGPAGRGISACRAEMRVFALPLRRRHS